MSSIYKVKCLQWLLFLKDIIDSVDEVYIES